MAETPPRSMSLIPYAPAESREIVLRHGSAVVVYDQRSRQLSLRGASHDVELSDCPYCHRPLREDLHHEENVEESSTAGFVNPDYFRMLHTSTPTSTESSRPPSPTKRIAQPNSFGEGPVLRTPDGAEFLASAPPPTTSSHGISSSAFSQGYFRTFFVEEKILGKGGKGVVLLVKHVLDGVSLGHFACKRVPVGDDHEWLEKVLLEVQLLQNLSHQNLVSYRHVWLEDYQLTTFGPSVPCAFILQQYCNSGDLHNYILGNVKTSLTPHELKDRLRRKSRGQLDSSNTAGPRRLQFDEIFSFFKDITSGLHHLHANGYIHRDLKPSNCLLHRTGQKIKVLVSDFGEVQVVHAARRSTGATGTISYCAPEVLKREAVSGNLGNFTTRSDIFSLGMIVYFMCFGRLPYANSDSVDEEKEDLDQLRAEISEWAGFDDQTRIRTDLPDRLYKFLKTLLSLEPSERPGTDVILQGIKGGGMLDELGPMPESLPADEPRISSADTPSPSPSRNHSRSSFTGPGRAPPGPSKLRYNSTVEPARSPSPTKGPAANESFTKADAFFEDTSSIVLRPRKTPPQDHVSSPHGSPSPPQSPKRLALPPPPPSSPTYILFYKLYHMMFVNSVSATCLKIVLFLLKTYSLFSPCTPRASNPWVAYPLLSMAAVDFAFTGLLGRGGGVGGKFSVPMVLLLVHVLVLAVVKRSDLLCLVGPRLVEVMGKQSSPVDGVLSFAEEDVVAGN